ncbi:MAG: sigma-70 family RNA polymerase sigma factor [Lachnospiraceae bacterium]|nr:sigma-70 family RNA polymerase sigma factor [Lachnospiraceae bacterium]
MEREIDSLIVEHLDNAKIQARKYYKVLPEELRSFIELDDLYQVGCVGLYKAAKRYKSTGEASFSTYSHSYIKGEILNEINHYSSTRAILVGEKVEELDKADESVRDDTTSSKIEDTMSEEDKLRIIKGKLKEIGLTEDETIVYLATEGIGRKKVTNLRALARELKTREMNIRRMRQKAEEKIKEINVGGEDE